MSFGPPVKPEGSTDLPSLGRPPDYYAILLETIHNVERNSAQLRAMVYERTRFNLKRDILFGYSSLSLTELLQHLNAFEHAVARIEANLFDGQPSLTYPGHERPPLSLNPGTAINAIPLSRATHIAPTLERPTSIHHWGESRFARQPKYFPRFRKRAALFIAAAFGAIVLTAIILFTIIGSPKPNIVAQPNPSELPKTSEAAPAESRSIENGTKAKVNPFPLPTSFGIYALSENKLLELHALSLNVPDVRVAVSAEIKTASPTTISDNRPSFILFRRDLLNSAPQTITLRVVARVARETAIIDGKANVAALEQTWRIRNVSQELKVAPIENQREMIIARLDDGVVLSPGRYLLVLNRIGYDFSIDGPTPSPAHCIEQFQAANGTIFTQCRKP